MPDVPAPAAPEPEIGPGRRLFGRVVLAVLLLGAAGLLAFTFARASIRPIRPDQATPAKHFDKQCAACHRISEDAEPVTVTPAEG